MFPDNNVKQMIMSVLGMNEEGRNRDPNPGPTPNPPKDDNLVQKLMEGSMVITAQDESIPKVQHSNLTSGGQSSILFLYQP